MVPTRIKIITTFAISMVVLPLLPPVPEVEALSLPGLYISVQQILIGFAMGFTLQLVFGALMIAGEVIAMSMGLGFASMIDPNNGVSVPVIAQLLVIVGTLLFLALGGHLMLIQLVVNSFQSLPIAPTGIERESFWAIASWGSQMFIGAIWVAIPAIISMLVVTLALGVMTRAAPQLNIFSVGFPITMFLGFIIIMLILPGILPRFNQMMLEAMQLSQSIAGL
jgi:flagellar biosynthetic protein FliR